MLKLMSAATFLYNEESIGFIAVLSFLRQVHYEV